MDLVKKVDLNKIAKITLVVLLGSILLTISAKIKIPFYPVPMTMQTFVVLFLGIAFSWGVFISSVELYGWIKFDYFLLYLACIFWTLSYDTIYAYQDREDDIKNNKLIYNSVLAIYALMIFQICIGEFMVFFDFSASVRLLHMWLSSIIVGLITLIITHIRAINYKLTL